MSSRALKRLQQSKSKSNTDTTSLGNEFEKKDSAGETLDEDGSSASDSDIINTRVNRFNLLLDDTQDDDVEQESEDDSPSNRHISPQANAGANSSKNKKKKDKKKKKRKQATNDEQEAEEDLDKILEEIQNETVDPFSVIQSDPVIPFDVISSRKSVLAVEHKNLDPQNELMRIFGSRVVRADNEHRRQRRNRTLRLAHPKDNWPPLMKSGLTMNLHETNNGYNYFTFHHNQQYQRVQQLFLDAAESMNPQNVMEVLRVHPYHIDTLLQMSDFTRMSEDMPMAAELIERSLYAQENAFHPMFSLTDGNSRLDYRFPENRSFMICLFRYITFVGLKGCYRTALEYCKLLLSLNPDEDPLGVLLMIDFYAIMSQEYTFLTQLYQDWQSNRNLSQLPNFAFSIPLAMYKRCLQKGESTVKADLMLQNSLLMFPHLLLPLLEKCSVKADATVSSHSFFAQCLTRTTEPVAIKQLCNLYVGRCYSCWKEVEVMTWLEVNVKVTLDLVRRDDSRVTTFETKRKTRYQGAPLNVYRHILMSDIKGSAADLPPEIARLSIRNYDPLPPRDSVVTYTRAPRRTRLQQDNNYLSTFLRSLLPNFNADEAVPEGGAIGGEVQSLQHGVAALMAAMRDLLQNIQPVPPPVENRHEDDENHEWD